MAGRKLIVFPGPPGRMGYIVLPEGMGGAGAPGPAGAAGAAGAAGPTVTALPIPAFEAVSTGTPELVQRNSHLVVGFATGEIIFLKGRLPPNYNPAVNLTVQVNGISATATTGDVVIGLRFDSLNTQDFDANTFAAQVTDSVTASGTSGVIFTAEFSLTAAQIDSTPAGGLFRLELERLAAGNTMAGDWQGVDVVMFQ